MTPERQKTARQFGAALDADNFAMAAECLAQDCVYLFGNEVLTGPVAICDSYEQNMIAGRAKLDELVWGESRISVHSELECDVHFQDYLKHKNQSHVFRCRQRLTFGETGTLIVKIQHIDDAAETAALHAFYKAVGLPCT